MIDNVWIRFSCLDVPFPHEAGISGDLVVSGDYDRSSAARVAFAVPFLFTESVQPKMTGL